MSCELMVFVATPNKDEAVRIAETLVSEHLAACVNILPVIESIYHWKGKINRDSETLLIIKTTDERYTDLERRIIDIHSYKTPEVVALKIERGANDYLKWLRDSTA